MCLTLEPEMAKKFESGKPLKGGGALPGQEKPGLEHPDKQKEKKDG